MVAQRPPVSRVHSDHAVRSNLLSLAVREASLAHFKLRNKIQEVENISNIVHLLFTDFMPAEGRFRTPQRPVKLYWNSPQNRLLP